MGIACPLRRSGNLPAARGQQQRLTQEAILRQARRITMELVPSTTTQVGNTGKRQLRWGVFRLMLLASMICTEMSENGAGTGTGHIPEEQRPTPQALPREYTVFFAAGTGTVRAVSCVPLSAAAITPPSVSPFWVSGSYATRNELNTPLYIPRSFNV